MPETQEEISLGKSPTGDPPESVRQKYDAAQIDKLEGLEAVRKRPGCTSATPMNAVCTTGFRGARQLDRRTSRRVTAPRLRSTIHVDGSVSIRDNGRGIPVDMHPKFKMPAVELVLTNLHAGGKFGQGAYKYSGGLARRRREMRQRAFRLVQGRGFARRQGLHMGFERGQDDAEAGSHRRGQKQEEHGHADHLPARSDDLHDHDRV